MARWQGFYDELAAERYPALLAYAAHAEHYVRRAIASVFIDDARREKLFRRTAHRLVRDDAAGDHAPETDARDAVAEALAALTPQVRVCVVLRYYDDLTVAQVADRLRLANGTVERYLRDAEALPATRGLIARRRRRNVRNRRGLRALRGPCSQPRGRERGLYPGGGHRPGLAQ